MSKANSRITIPLSDYLPSTYKATVIESYKITFMRGSLGIYGQRILRRIMEAAQDEIDKLTFAKGQDCRKIDIPTETKFEDRTVLTMNLRSIIRDTNNITDSLRKEISNLVGLTLTYEDEKKYVAIPFLYRAEILKNSLTLQVTVPIEIWKVIMDFSNGFRTISMEKAMTLRSEFSLRIYEMMSGQTMPRTFSISEFRQQFGLTNKYPIDRELIRSVIKPAKKELDSKMPYTFDLEPLYARQGEGRTVLTGFTFQPVYQEQFDEQKKLAPTNEKNNEVRNEPIFSEQMEKIMFDRFNMDHQSLMNNAELFKQLLKRRDFARILAEAEVLIKEKDGEIKNPVGFLIDFIQKKMSKKN